MKCFVKGYDVSTGIEDKGGKATGLYGMAVTYHQMQKPHMALYLFHKCEVLQMKLHDRWGIAQTYAELGRLHAEMENFDEAAQYFLDAFTLFEMLDSLPGKLIVKRYVEGISRDSSFHNAAHEVLVKIGSIGGYENRAELMAPAHPLIQYL